MKAKKTHTITFLALFIAAGIVCSCEQKKRKGLEYFNIDSLVNAQVRYLSSQRATLTKRSQLNAKHDSITTTSVDSMFWYNELEGFKQLESVNKPLNRKAYRVERFPDPQSNLTILSIATKEPLPVEFIRIYYQGDVKNLRKVEALYHEGNYLYGSQRMLVMNYEKIYNKITLTHYSIMGKQKVLLGDSVHYSIAGIIKIN